MAEEKSESRKEALIDQVLQCQIVIARHIGLDRDVIEFLDNITDWKKENGIIWRRWMACPVRIC